MVLGTQIEDGLIGLHASGFAVEVRLLQHDLPRIVGNDAVLGLDHCGFRSTQLEVNLRRQNQLVALSLVLDAYSPSRGLWRSELDAGIGRRVSRVLVENQIARFQVQRVL